MKFVTLTAATALLAGGAAYAGGPTAAPSEPLVMAPAPAPIMAPAQTWTGGYAGLSLGYGDGELDNTADFDGAIGGGFAGYRYDMGSVVLGAELDLNAANLDFDNGLGEVDELHRLKFQAGYDAGNTLIYGVAGAAYAAGEANGSDFSENGYVLGAGVDYKITPNVNVGGEVLYHDFSDVENTGNDADATTVQARVSYQF